MRSCRRLLAELAEPLLSSTLIPAGATEPMNDPEEIRVAIKHALELIIDSGACHLRADDGRRPGGDAAGDHRAWGAAIRRGWAWSRLSGMMGVGHRGKRRPRPAGTMRSHGFSLFETIVLWAVPVVFAITLHEAAHGYVARIFGDQTAYMLGRVTLNPLKHIDPVGTIVGSAGAAARAVGADAGGAVSCSAGRNRCR